MYRKEEMTVQETFVGTDVEQSRKSFREYEKKVTQFWGMNNLTETFLECLPTKKESIKSMLARNITKSQKKSAVESSTIIRHSKDSQCL